MPGGNAADPMGVNIFPNGSLSAANTGGPSASGVNQNQQPYEEEESKTSGGASAANTTTTTAG